uniref:Uncharacterized protein n=1 Tax=Ditylenchus dipsaci TaxID=166011 RepID=A0A915CZB5_9BILA
MSATEISSKQSADLGLLLLDMESRIIEQFKEVVSSFVEDLGDRLDSIYDDVGRMMQSMEKQEKSIHTLHLKMEKHSEHQQRNLKAQLQEKANGQDTRYNPPQQSRDPGQQDHHKCYDPNYRKPEPTYQRPQYDSSPRYRPDFEPNHCYRSDYDGNQRYKPDYNCSQHYRPDYGTNQQNRPEFEPNQRFQKKQYSPSYSPKTDSYRKNFDYNGIDRFQGDTASMTSEKRNGGGSMQSAEQESFQPNSFGIKQKQRPAIKDSRNYQEDDGPTIDYDRDLKGEDNQQARFSSLSPTNTSSDLHRKNPEPATPRFTAKKGGFGCSVQQNSNSNAQHMPHTPQSLSLRSKKMAEDHPENHLEDSNENRENQGPISQAASIASPIYHEDSSSKPRFSGGFGQSTKTGGFGCATQKSLAKACFLQSGGNVAVQKDGYNDHDGLHLNTFSESTSEKLHSALDECLQTDTIPKETNIEQENYSTEPNSEDSNQSATSQETVVENFSDGEQDQPSKTGTPMMGPNGQPVQGSPFCPPGQTPDGYCGFPKFVCVDPKETCNMAVGGAPIGAPYAGSVLPPGGMGYGTPMAGGAGYGAGYGMPANGYGTQMGGYGMPGYGNQMGGYGMPGYNTQMPGFGTGFGAQMGGYGMPGTQMGGYGMPGYGTPQMGGYGMPGMSGTQMGGYGMPGYGTPQMGGYGMPGMSGTQMGGYGMPGYGTPQMGGFGMPGFGMPMGGYGNTMGGYGQSGMYGQPMNGMTPMGGMNGYGTQTGGYVACVLLGWFEMDASFFNIRLPGNKNERLDCGFPKYVCIDPKEMCYNTNCCQMQDSDTPGYGMPGYGGQIPGYGGQVPGYGGQVPGYGGQIPGYGGQVPGYGGQVPGYGGQIPGYGGQVPGYGGQVPGYGGQIPGYGGQVPGYGGQIPGYGGQVPGYGGQVPGYGGQVPGYGGQIPGYGGQVPGYGGQIPSGVCPPRMTVVFPSQMQDLDTVQPYTQPYAQPYAQPYTQPYAQPYTQPYAQPYSQPYGQPYRPPTSYYPQTAYPPVGYPSAGLSPYQTYPSVSPYYAQQPISVSPYSAVSPYGVGAGTVGGITMPTVGLGTMGSMGSVPGIGLGSLGGISSLGGLGGLGGLGSLGGIGSVGGLGGLGLGGLGLGSTSSLGGSCVDTQSDCSSFRSYCVLQGGFGFMLSLLRLFSFLCDKPARKDELHL